MDYNTESMAEIAQQVVKAFQAAVAERDRLAELRAWGFEDVFRRFYADDRLYTYWDYRAGDFHQHRGMRIDLALATAPLAERATFTTIDRNARKGKLPSDHTPLIVDFDVPTGL